MSATGRGGERIAEDFYPTPAWCTRRILEALPCLTNATQTWLEPCAGDGAIVRVMQEMLPLDSYIDGGDVRNLPSCVPHCWTVGGFDTHIAHHDVVITNPPFSLAPELIAHFLPRCNWLILLLRSSFKLCAGEPGREGYRNYRDNMPDEYKLPQRPEFVASEKCDGVKVGKRQYAARGLVAPCDWSQKLDIKATPTRTCPACGGNVQRSTTDASEYSWFVWTPERNRSAGLTRILPDTPLEERRADR